MASFHPEDSLWLIATKPPGKLNEVTESLMFMTFDQQTLFDSQKIEKSMKETKFLKRVCLYKLAIFIPEYILSFILFSKNFRAAKKKLIKAYYKYWCNEIDMVKFKEELKRIAKEEKEII